MSPRSEPERGPQGALLRASGRRELVYGVNERASRARGARGKHVAYYDTPEQKQLVDERARAAHRSASSYIRHTLLQGAGATATMEAQLQRLTQEAARLHDETRALRRERDELAAHTQALEREARDLRAELAEAREALEAASDLPLDDSRAWQILVAARNEQGEFEPVLERNILIELDAVDNPERIRLLKARFAHAAEAGILEREEVRGKTAYRWRGAGEAN